MTVEFSCDDVCWEYGDAGRRCGDERVSGQSSGDKSWWEANAQEKRTRLLQALTASR